MDFHGAFLHAYRRRYNVVYRSGCSGNALYESFIILEAIKNRQTYTCLPIFLMNSYEMMFCFNSLRVLLVLVNHRPANCDSRMELGESSTSEISYPLGFPRHAFYVGVLVTSKISECYFWSFRGVNNSLLHFV